MILNVLGRTLNVFCFQLTIENVGEADEAKSYSCGLTFMGYNNKPTITEHKIQQKILNDLFIFEKF
jgi:hypothetical protein